MLRIVSLVIAFAFVAATSAQEPAIDWKSAERQIVRLLPSAFTQVPPGIRQELTRRGCTVPQVWDEVHRHNVIQGHLESSKAIDWIVLCSVKRTSSILVFRSSAARPFAQLAPFSDSIFLQGTLPGKAGFSRRVSVISAKDILGYCKLWNQKCPRTTHDGIEDIFEEKASTIFYFSGHKWVKLSGAD